MTELAKTALFTYAEAPKETELDNTTRIVRRITEDEARSSPEDSTSSQSPFLE